MPLTVVNTQISGQFTPGSTRCSPEREPAGRVTRGLSAVLEAVVLLDAAMPRWDEADRHAISVAAPAERTYLAVRRVDLAASPIARALLAIRNLPALARGRRVPASLTLDDAVRAGFVVLAEEPGREIVLGVAGRFWTLSGGRTAIRRDQFAGHAEPGTAKAAISFRVDPDGPERCRVVTETRVLCADADARRSFRRYWRLVRPGSALIRRAALARIKRDAEAWYADR